MTIRSLTTIGILVGALTTSASAETLFQATLNGVQAGTPSTATGSASLILNDAQTEVAYTITFSGLEGTEGAAHFHNAAPGQNGPVLAGLPLGSPKVGVWNVSPGDVVELFAGRVYINVHTDVYATGEIRGDVSFVAVPADETSWSEIKSDYR